MVQTAFFRTAAYLAMKRAHTTYYNMCYIWQRLWYRWIVDRGIGGDESLGVRELRVGEWRSYKWVSGG